MKWAAYIALASAIVLATPALANAPKLADCLNDPRFAPRYFASESMRRQLVAAFTREGAVRCYWSEVDPFSSGAAPSWTACVADKNLGCAVVAAGTKVYVPGANAGTPPAATRWTLIGAFAPAVAEAGEGKRACVAQSARPDMESLPVFDCR